MSDSAVLNPSDFVFSPSSGSVMHNDITLEEMEKKMILDYLKRYSNNINMVAGKLGITRQTLYNKIKKYNL
jgi:transcriptional regulator with PAS, ATPase and Fis domain